MEHAEIRKHDVEKEVMLMRTEFDEKLSKETDEKLRELRAEREANLNLKMKEEREKNERFIEQLKEEFAENHEVYAKEILKKILEV